jgi:hypothetical protein
MYDEQKLKEVFFQSATFNLVLYLAKQSGMSNEELESFLNYSIDMTSDHIMGTISSQIESMDKNEEFMNKLFGVDLKEKTNEVRIIGNDVKNRITRMFEEISKEEEKE